MKSNEQVSTIIAALKTLYPDALCSLDYEKDYELLFSVRLRRSAPTRGSIW